MLGDVGHLHTLPINFSARPGYKGRDSSSSPESMMKPVPLTDEGLLPPGFSLEDPDSHYIYVCKKITESSVGIPDQVQPAAV